MLVSKTYLLTYYTYTVCSMYLGSHDHKGQLRIGRRQGGGADWGLDLEIGYLLATGAYSETPNLATPDFSSSSFQPMAGSTYLEVAKYQYPRCIVPVPFFIVS